MTYEHELRLAWAVAINVVALAAAGRAARRTSADPALRLYDTFLWWYLIQYAAVCLCGLVGVLTPAWLSVAGIGLSAVLLFAIRGRVAEGSEPTPAERTIFSAAAAFVAAFTLAAVWDARLLPAVGDDPLTYHLPAAAAWLQAGRIGVYETWFFNPANAYSPLAGSAFAAWLIAPFGCDVAARFVQAPAVLAIFATAAGVARRLGAGMIVAALIGIAVALCRPIITQAIFAKDDLFLCAFVLAAVAGAGRSDRLAPIRIGAAIGLAAATKFTAVYPLLALIPLATWPRGPTAWRRAGFAAAVALVIAGPWYLRNWIVAGSPIFPVRGLGFDGLFATVASPRLQSVEGLRRSLVEGYFGIGWAMTVAALAAWAASIVVAGRAAWRSPVARCVVLGPPLCVAAFLRTSPYAELRFVIAAVSLLVASVAVWANGRQGASTVVAAAVAAAAVTTAFEPSWAIRFVAAAAVGAAVAAVLQVLWTRRPGARAIVVATAGIAAFALAWVNWRAYVLSLPEAAGVAWADRYGTAAEAWRFVRERIPRGEPIAYTNAYLAYPLMGPRLDRPVMHVPVSPRVARLADLPRIDGALHEETLLPAVVRATYAGADREAWRRRVLQSPATWVVVFAASITPDSPAPPPELEWASDGDPAFARVFENPAAVVFKVEREATRRPYRD